MSNPHTVPYANRWDVLWISYNQTITGKNKQNHHQFLDTWYMSSTQWSQILSIFCTRIRRIYFANKMHSMRSIQKYTLRLTGVGWKHSWCYERGHDSWHCWWGISRTLPQTSLRVYARLSRACVHPWLGWICIGRVWVVSVLLLAIWLLPGLFITWREIWL